jgi:DNA-binding NarL/FixJ family response regulator
MKSKIQIIIVDDSRIFLEGIQEFLEKDVAYEIVAVFNSGSELLQNINEYDPDLILLDIEMPGLNGIETARQLSRFGIDLRLVAMSLYMDKYYIKGLIEAGFRGMVNKNEIPEKLTQILEYVMQGKLAFPQKVFTAGKSI